MRQPVRLPSSNGHAVGTPRVLLLAGGNAAGKTTALQAAQARHAHRADWAWYYPDSGGGPLKGKAPVQLRTLLRLWSDRRLTGIAVEATRFHNAVFRTMGLNAYPRHLYVAFMNQSADVLVEHLRTRNARNQAARLAKGHKPGKGFNDTYWAGPKNLRKADYEGRRRVPNVLQKLLAAHPELAPRIHTQTFEVGLDYTVLPQVGAWIDQVVG